MAKKKKSEVTIAPSLTSRMKADEGRWEREQDLRTLRDASAIKKDPKRLAAAKAEAKAQMKALESVTE